MTAEMTIAGIVFITAYFVNITTITVFYHRGLAHGAVKLTRSGRFFVSHFGMWLTGIDPKGWVCMHRLHHIHSDTKKDPHSPVNGNVWRVFFDQHKSFERILVGLIRESKHYTQVVSDLDYLSVHPLNRKGLWWLPLAIHFSIGAILGVVFANPWLALAYAGGMASHPVQGWLVNAFGHHSGYRNYDLSDHSTNNWWVALTVVGEGYQNNHHRFPTAAKFSKRWFEVDSGYAMVWLTRFLGLVTFPRSADKGAEASVAAPKELATNQ